MAIQAWHLCLKQQAMSQSGSSQHHVQIAASLAMSVLQLKPQEAGAAEHELPDGQRLVVQPEQAWALGDLLLDPGSAGAASPPLPDCLASACASLPDPAVRKVIKTSWLMPWAPWGPLQRRVQDAPAPGSETSLWQASSAGSAPS